MRIIRLSDSKVQVTLTTADLVGLDVDIDELKPNSKELHSFLFNIMETINEETDFNPYNGQVVVEAMPSSEGICIIVSKIHMLRTDCEKKPNRKIKSITPHIKKDTGYTFYIDNIDNVCSVLKETNDAALVDSALYKLDGKYCYILKNVKKHSSAFGVLVEFSSKHSSRPMQTDFIAEHGTLIAKSDSLIRMADGVRQLD